MKRKNNIKLLPYIREDIYGSVDKEQHYGWEINKFDIRNQWNYSTGRGVVVAVIDTGCDFNHIDIKDNIIQGKNFVEINKDPMDFNGHGTHVAGTIAAINNGKGIVGVAPESKIMPVKALDNSGSGSSDNIVKAIIWSADNKADIITMSLGSPVPSKAIENAINYAASKGTIIFCAAGNAGEATDVMYPAKFNNTIAIGAIDENLNRTSFTCSGDTLDFLAPGHNIISCVPNNGYASMSGTSMSNPFAVGCASLLLSYNKKIKKYELNNTKNYIDIFKSKSKPLANPKYSGIHRYEGYGIMYPIF
jgi:subtilisin family serine protease